MSNLEGFRNFSVQVYYPATGWAFTCLPSWVDYETAMTACQKYLADGFEAVRIWGNHEAPGGACDRVVWDSRFGEITRLKLAGSAA